MHRAVYAQKVAKHNANVLAIIRYIPFVIGFVLIFLLSRELFSYIFLNTKSSQARFMIPLNGILGRPPNWDASLTFSVLIKFSSEFLV